MSASTLAPAGVETPTPRGAGRRIPWPQVADAAVLSFFVFAAFLLYRPLWMNLSRGYLQNSAQDQNMWEWFFAVTAHSVLNLENPLHSGLQNAPDGVNLMANTAMFGLGIPLTPVTVLFGPTVTWAAALTGGIAGTAAAWYWVMSRHLVLTRAGAAIGAAFAGFAPSIVSHGNAHPNFVALFVLPFIVLWLLKLARGERVVRNGVVLGLLVSYQILLGEEPLLIAATTLAVFGLVYAVLRPEEALSTVRPLAKGIGVGAAVSVVIVAVPLWWQFFGPQSYAGIEHGLRGNDVAAFTAFATQTVAGDEQSAVGLAMNPTEENAFFGWPLVILMLVLTVALWRDVVSRALAITMLGMAWISMGALLVVDGEGTSIPGPWMLLFDVPLFDSVLESRFALGCVPVVGLLLARATDRVLRLRVRQDWRQAAAIVWFSVLTFALVPIAPTELAVGERGKTPAFFTGGEWRRYVDDGSVVVVPVPNPSDADALHWQIESGLEFPLAGGYFVGPDGGGDGRYGPPYRATTYLLQKVHETGRVPELTDEDRRNAVEDLRYWRADVVVLPIGGSEHQVALRQTVEGLLGRAGEIRRDVWVWDVRTLVDTHTDADVTSAVPSSP
ncbi:glycosyl transferase [Saccharomonospora sp. NB11]|uniref:glycosyl transferase n=1 Tax=Saccharomonospora sp. NB11 TaxID=1642298 RepID=UPI0018D13D14|nr:glycosyl transferase [Saccharomonospora sp. NB11]